MDSDIMENKNAGEKLITISIIAAVAAVCISGFLIFRDKTDSNRELISEMGNIYIEKALF